MSSTQPDSPRPVQGDGALGWWRGAAWLPIPFLLVTLGVLRVMEPQTAYESPFLLAVLNLLCSTVAALVVAVLVGRSYLVGRAPGLLLLGCGVVAWGAAGSLSPVLLHHGSNALISGHSSLVWVSAVCNLAGALLAVRPHRAPPRPGLTLAVSYASVLGIVWLVAALAMTGRMPAFFVQDQGGTPLRTAVLSSAALMFVLTTGLLWRAHRPSPSAFVRWYGLALLLVATGLLGVMIQPAHGSLLGWAGRTAQSLGGLYMVVAAVASVRESGAWTVTLSAALREARQRYDELMDLAPDGIVVHELITPATRGNFVQANPAICRLLGYTAAEMRELTPLDILAPEQVQEVPADTAVLASRNVLRHEKTLVAKDGRRIPTEITTRQVRQGDRTMVISLIRDMTERKAAEAAWRASEARYSLLFQNMTEGFVLYEVITDDQGRPCDGRFLDVNPAFERLTATCRAELLGRSAREVLPDGARHWVESFTEVALTGEPLRLEHHSAADRWWEVSAYRAGPGRVGAVYTDITERRRAEWESRAARAAALNLMEDAVEARRLAEAAAAEVHESEERLRLALEAARMATWEWDVVSGRVVWNDEHYRLLGYEPGAFVPSYEHWASGIHPDDRAATEAALRRCLTTGDDYTATFRTLWPDGTVRWLQALGRLWGGSPGQPVRCYGVMWDVTAGRVAEEALRQSREDLNRAQAVARTGSWRLDIEKNELSWSDENWRIFGVPRGTPLSYETFLATVHPDDRHAVDASWQAALRGEPYEVEHRVVVGQEVRWVRERAEMEFDRAGRLLAGFGTTQDITASRQAEAALRASEERYRALFSTMAEGFALHEIVLDGQGRPVDYRFLDVNPAFERLTGLQRDAVLGRRVLEVLPGTEPYWIERYGQVVLSGEPLHLEEWSAALARWYDAHAYRVAPGRFAVLFSDITPRKLAEEEIRQLNRDLEVRVQQRTTELRASEARLRHLAAQLATAQDEEQQRIAEALHDDVAQILAASSVKLAVATLSPDLTSTRKYLGELTALLDEANEKVRLMSFELGTTLYRLGLDEALRELAESIEERHGIRTVVTSDGGGRRLDSAAAVVLYKATRELLFNVVKHAGIHEASVVVRAEGGWLTVAVEDRGKGFTAPPGAAGSGIGTGLGLFGIRERVGDLGGSVRIESEPGVRTCVTLTVPLDGGR
jgi:PAS domain S-box-containing protein